MTTNVKEGLTLKSMIIKAGYSFTDICKKLNIDRGTLYNMFTRDELKPEYVKKFLTIGIDPRNPKPEPVKETGEPVNEGKLFWSILKENRIGIQDCAEKLGLSRRQLYNLFKQPKINKYYVDKLAEVGIIVRPNDPTMMVVPQPRPIPFRIRQPLQSEMLMPKSGIFPQRAVPYYDLDVFAGNLTIFNQDGTEAVTDYVNIPGMRDCTLLVNVSGDSMYPTFKRGDVIGLKEIKEKEVLEYGQPYVLITDENRFLKYVRKAEHKAKWLLKSENPKYDDFEIDKNIVRRVFLVRGIVRSENI